MTKISPKKFALLAIAIISTFSIAAQSNPSSLLKDWVTAQETNTEPILPNFSFAGYHNGSVGLPSSFSQQVYDVTDPLYGAVADDGNSDKSAIIAAIAAAELNPSGGIVFFPPGEFLINESTDDIDQIIRISKSNIVLKGSGSGTGGTTLTQTSYTNPTNPSNFWTCPYLFRFKPTSTNRSQITTITANAARETYEVNVASASGITAGQWIRLKLSDNTPALVTEEFAPYAVNTAYTSISNEVKTWEVHKVASVTGNTIKFIEPIHRSINATYNWILETFPVIEEVGFQDFTYKGGMTTAFVHHSGWQQDSGWSGVEFNQVANSWLSNVTFTQMSNAAHLKLSAYSSAIQNRYVGNAGHAFISANASTGCVIGLNKDNSSGIHHGSGVSGPSIGNVIWRNEHPTNGNSGYEIHANQPRANLIDGCKGGFGFNYGGSASNQPNHLRHLVLWNFEGKGYRDTDFQFWRTDNTYAKVIPPIVSGLVGFTLTTDTTQYQENESPGTHVDEFSLYEAQLTHRLGALPSWIDTALRTETFDNTTTTGWSTEVFTGENGIQWTLDAKSTSGYVNGTKDIYMRSGKTGATSGTISGGISSFSVSCKNLWESGVDRTLELLVNGSVVGTKVDNSTGIYTFDVANINIEGNITIAIRNASNTGSNKSVAIDNISWVGYTPFHPSSITLATSNISIQIGETSTLTKTVYPSYAVNKTVNWSSSNAAIATVDASGLVTGITTGIATITATTVDGNLTASTTVAVGATETFENTTITGWSTETYTGDHGFVWTLNSKSTAGYIDATKDIYMQAGKTGALSNAIPGGISSFSISCKDLWDSGVERKLELLVNGSVVGSRTHTGSGIYTFEVTGLTISGNITIGIRNASPTGTNKTIALDNLSWTPYTAPSGSKAASKPTKNTQEETEEISFETNVYPNPFTYNLNITIEKGISELILFDMKGRIVFRKTTNNLQQITLEPSYDKVPKGIYILRLLGDQKTKSIKLIRN